VRALGDLEKPECDDGGPHRFMNWLEGGRTWFALAAVLAAVIGVVFDLGGGTIWAIGRVESPATSPLTALSIMCLAAAIISSDRRNGSLLINAIMSFLAIALCLLPHTAMMIGFTQIEFDTFRGQVGVDTALIVSLLAVCVMMRFRLPVCGLISGMVGTALVLNGLIGQTYGLPYFDGQMAPMTLVSLIFGLWAITSLYLHRPLVRVMFLSGSIGTRTRLMMGVSFAAPWACGFLLHHWYGVPEREFHVEAALISAIIWIMMAVTLASGFLQEKADQKRRAAERKLRQQAIHDPLTGLLNRAGLAQALSAQWQRFERQGVSAAVVLIDLDRFKLVNDTFGHMTGDAVLRSVRHALLPFLREEDAVGRWGGEEFLCVLNDTELRNLHQISERVRLALQAISDLPAVSHGKGRVPVSGSIGVSTFMAGDRGYEAAIKRADTSLYAAKRNGRNRVVFDPALRRTFIRPQRPESVLTA
jgi:diguanylate cyclase (GGDEF)-like protein